MFNYIYHYCFETKQMPIWEAFQYVWACMLVGNAKSLKAVPIAFIETLLIGITPYWLNIFVLRHTDSYELYDHSLLLLILIFAILQLFPMKIIMPLNMPYLIFMHSVNVIRRFIYCHSRVINMPLSYSLPATLFIASSDSILCFAVFKLMHSSYHKYCDRFAFVRSSCGCLVYFITSKLGYISEQYNAILAAVIITLFDYITIFYRSWMELHQRMRRRETVSD